MGNRLRTEDFLHRCSFTVVSTATTPRPTPVDPAPPTRVRSARGDVGAPSPTGPRRRAGTGYDAPVDGGVRDTSAPGGVRPDRGVPGLRDARDAPRLRGGVRRPERNPYLAGVADLVLVLVLTIVFSVVFGAVAGRDVFGGGVRQLFVWVIVTVIAWVVCATARSGRQDAGATPHHPLTGGFPVPGTFRPAAGTDR